MRKIGAFLALLLAASGASADGIHNPQTNASALTTGTVAAARGGAGTVNGALKGNGSGTVSQAACADLSNAAAGCSSTSLPVTSLAVTCTRDLSTATSTQTIPNATDCGGVTTFGFQPSACDADGAVSNNTFIVFSAHSGPSLSQWSWEYLTGGPFFEPTYFMAPADGSTTNYQTAQLTAYNATTLTLSWTKTGSPTGTFTFVIRCFK